MADDGNKPHEATAKRRQEYRDDGKFAKARDTTAIATVGGSMLALLATYEIAGSSLNELVGRCFGHLDEVLTSDPFSVLASIPRTAAWLIVPTAVTAALAAAAIGFAQNGFRFYPKMLEPKFDRIDPIGRLKQMLNPKNASFELALALFRVVVVGAVVYDSLLEKLPMLLRLTTYPVGTALSIIFQVLMYMTLKCMLVLFLMAAIDYAYSWYKLEQEMKMSTQELKEESKQQELDPQLKGRMRRRMNEVGRQRVIDAVPEASVVVTNPSHFAVAIRYNPDDAAPVVVAKGVDALALRIRAEARKHSIPIVENRPLARALYAEVEMGRIIGVEHYVAVAEVLAFVFGLRDQRRQRRDARAAN